MVCIKNNFANDEFFHGIDWQALPRRGLLTALSYCCFAEVAFSQSSLRDETKLSLANYSTEDAVLLESGCNSTGDVIIFNGKTVLCVSKSMRMDDIDWHSITNKKFDFTFVNSSTGGSVLAAIKLGRLIYNQNLPILVSGVCLSSCANYLIPASREVKILKNTYVGFHGTPSRSEKEYLKQFKTFSKSEIEERKAFFRKNTYAEIDYFFDIGVNENYATFVYYSGRKLLSQARPECKPSARTFYILGPKHAAAYNLLVGDSWFPKSRKDFEPLIDSVLQQSFIYDYDYEPFYISGRGFTSSKTCQTSVLSKD